MDSLIEVKNLIYEIRGYKVMLDSDLAELYEVQTFRLNEAVKRNIERFPSHYMFQLTKDEYKLLTSQIAISKKGRGGRRTMPYVFTEQGVAMLSSVLNSARAIQINIKIIDTFVQLRQWALDNKELTKRVADIENYLMNYAKDNNKEIEKIYEAIDFLMDRTKPRKIGFEINEK
jgi:hypothetical protein